MNPIACKFDGGKTDAEFGAISPSSAPLVHLTGIFPQPVATQPRPLSLADWIDAITKVWRKSAANTLELAGLLSQAKCRLRYGDWSRLWHCGRIPFSKRKGEMLVVIGQTLGYLDAQTSAQLPSAWNTLYFVARLGRLLVEQLIQRGRIHLRLTLKEAKALLAEFKPELVQNRTHRRRVKQQFSRFADFVSSTVANWSQEERQFSRSEMLRLVEVIESGGEANHHIESQQTTDELASIGSLRQRNGSPVDVYPKPSRQRS